MDKIFKKLCSFLSYLLIASTILLSLYIPTYVRSEKKVNFFSSKEIAENILNMEMNMTSIVYVKNDSGEWEEYQRLHGDENRIWVTIDKIPKNLQNAFIAIEDERFNSHIGVDWKRTIGAVSNYYLKFSASEFGGSTITQQLIKNVTMDKGKNADRKFREIIRALSIERHLNKTQILEAYLNTISLGNDICGVQVAANYYFNKEVSELNLTECAALAAITKNPSRYNPVTGVEGNRERRNTVLNKMIELKMITKDEYYAAYDKDIVLDDSQEDNYEPEVNDYFIDALIDNVIEDLKEKYNCNEDFASTMLYNGGFKIYSTLNRDIQITMEDVYLNTDKYFNIYGKDQSGEKVHSQSAMTIMDYEGHIVGIVGGAGEKLVNRGLNRATSSPRQPGSTMKPIGVYALAIENDLIHYSSKVLDKPIDNYYPDGKAGPKEWYGYYKGTITVDTALRTSANTIPVRLLKDLGIDVSYDFLKNKLHCKYLTEEDKNLASLALGGSRRGITTTESAAAFAIFGSDGIYHKPTTYYKIERNGAVIIDYDENGERVISSSTATIMNHLLQGVVYGSGGTGSRISSFSNKFKAYAKTGTSSDANDCWMVAGTPYYIGSVWYGFDLPQKVSKTSGAAEIWRDIMKDIHKELEPKEFVDSPDVYKKGSGYYKKNTVPDNTANLGGSSSQSSSEASSVASSTPEESSSSSSSSNSSTTSSEGTSSSDTSSSTNPPDNEDGTSTETTPSSPEESPTEPPTNSNPTSPPSSSENT